MQSVSCFPAHELDMNGSNIVKTFPTSYDWTNILKCLSSSQFNFRGTTDSDLSDN